MDPLRVVLSWAFTIWPLCFLSLSYVELGVGAETQIAIVASIIFKLADGDAPVTPGFDEPTTAAGKSGVAWVLRFGGLMALVGCVVE